MVVVFQFCFYNTLVGGATFYNPNNSKKKKAVMMMAGGFLLLIVAICLLVFTSSGNSGNKDAVILANQKREILMSALLSEPLSDAKKQEILKAISGNEIDKFNFTTEEVARIVEGLNR